MRRGSWIIFFLFVLAIVLTNMVGIYQHEIIHHRINTYYGYDSRIVFTPAVFYTEILLEENQTLIRSETMNALHTMNEIEGYNAQMLASILSFIGVFVVFLLLNIYERYSFE